MKLIKCRNGHLYDKEVHSFCPHCKKNYKPTDSTRSIMAISKENFNDRNPHNKLLESINQEKIKALKKNNKKVTKAVLKCILGNNIGDVYCIREGENSIGRNSNNDICINNDLLVSRAQHAFVCANKKNYEIKAGNSKGFFYVNGKVVLLSENLKNGDIVKIGKSELIFYTKGK